VKELQKFQQFIPRNIASISIFPSKRIIAIWLHEKIGIR